MWFGRYTVDIRHSFLRRPYYKPLRYVPPSISREVSEYLLELYRSSTSTSISYYCINIMPSRGYGETSWYCDLKIIRSSTYHVPDEWCYIVNRNVCDYLLTLHCHSVVTPNTLIYATQHDISILGRRISYALTSRYRIDVVRRPTSVSTTAYDLSLVIPKTVRGRYLYSLLIYRPYYIFVPSAYTVTVYKEPHVHLLSLYSVELTRAQPHHMLSRYVSSFSISPTRQTVVNVDEEVTAYMPSVNIVVPLIYVDYEYAASLLKRQLLHRVEPSHNVVRVGTNVYYVSDVLLNIHTSRGLSSATKGLTSMTLSPPNVVLLVDTSTSNAFGRHVVLNSSTFYSQPDFKSIKSNYIATSDLLLKLGDLLTSYSVLRFLKYRVLYSIYQSHTSLYYYSPTIYESYASYRSVLGREINLSSQESILTITSRQLFRRYMPIEEIMVYVPEITVVETDTILAYHVPLTLYILSRESAESLIRLAQVLKQRFGVSKTISVTDKYSTIISTDDYSALMAVVYALLGRPTSSINIEFSRGQMSYIYTSTSLKTLAYTTLHLLSMPEVRHVPTLRSLVDSVAVYEARYGAYREQRVYVVSPTSMLSSFARHVRLLSIVQWRAARGRITYVQSHVDYSVSRMPANVYTELAYRYTVTLIPANVSTRLSYEKSLVAVETNISTHISNLKTLYTLAPNVVSDVRHSRRLSVLPYGRLTISISYSARDRLKLLRIYKLAVQSRYSAMQKVAIGENVVKAKVYEVVTYGYYN